MDIKTTFKVYQTAIEMLKDRGYIVSDDNEIDINEFSIMYQENNYDIIGKRDGDDRVAIYVAFFREAKTISKKDLDGIVVDLKTQYGNDVNIIIILKEKYNVAIEKELANPQYKNVEMFLYRELIFNITHHDLVPKHIPLSLAEITELLARYKCTKNQLPKILASDPVSRYYGIKSGGVFKIIRNSITTGSYPTYRYVK